MALADYFERSQLAASQVLDGFDPDVFAESLGRTSVGIAFDPDIELEGEGAYLVDLLVRLLARLYPTLDVWCSGKSDRRIETIGELAHAINPAIEITSRGLADVGIIVGGGQARFETTIFAGSDGWDALISSTQRQALGTSPNPLGAGAAACIAASNVFRRVFLSDWEERIDSNLVLSTYSFAPERTAPSVPKAGWHLADAGVLAGVGAIGMAVAWALARSPISGTVHLVDPEAIELSNLQRYVLPVRSDVGQLKVQIAVNALRDELKGHAHKLSWREFVSKYGYKWGWVLAALDTAEGRREVQSSLPRWIANAWTQPGDLGVSVHPDFGGPGACLACLYLPDGQVPNEDEVVSRALGIPGRIADVRTLLHLGGPVPEPLLSEVAASLGIEQQDARRFLGQSIRDLYVHGICGGALLPIGRLGAAPAELHVPLAHQSSLAGILLAAKLCRMAVGGQTTTTTIARIDVLRKIPPVLEQTALRRGDGRCLCDDTDFTNIYRSKYAGRPSED